MTISEISKSFVWDYKKAIIPVTVVAIPLAIELGCFIKNVYKDPTIVKRKFTELKLSLVDAFKRRSNENTTDFRKRFLRNITITSVATLAIGAAVAGTFILFPPAFAIPIALSTIASIGKLGLYIQKNPNIANKAKNYLVDAFTQRKDEIPHNFNKRRWEAIKKIALVTTVFAATITASFFIPGFIAHSLKAPSVWAISKLIPFQTKAVIFAEYLLVGALHGIQALRYKMKGDHARAAFHLTAALSAVFFPIWHMMSNNSELTLHHSILGLILQLAPSQAVRTFGSFVTLDSFMYVFSNQRGFSNEKGSFSNYDYMNAVYAQFPLVVQGLVGMTVLQQSLEYLSKDKETTNTAVTIKKV